MAEMQSNKPKLPSNKSFGITFAVVFALIGIFPVAISGAPIIWALGVSVVFALVTLAWPSALSVPNRIWFEFGKLLHMIVSPVVMGGMFFVVIVPIGVFMRAFGKDFLSLKKDSKSTSYWIDRKPPGPDAGSFKNQF